MLRSLKDLERHTVSATDGDIGTVVDFLFDDEHWGIRYLVVDTDGVLGVRRVLISPISFRHAEWTTGRFQLSLTKDKVRRSPGVDVDRPVSRQHERDHHRYYGHPVYWRSVGLLGLGAFPGSLSADRRSEVPAEHVEDAPGDSHLQSAREVRGYHIEGIDAPIGHVEDFIVDDETWQIRYLVVDTSNWWFGRKVLVAPEWAKAISWAERKLHVDMGRDEIKSGPEWNADAAIARDYESQLFDYYGRPVYWSAAALPLGREPPPPAY